MLQPTINIGMIGHVSNGKSTITKMITGESTQRHSKEKSMNLTIKLGYANSRICKCRNCTGVYQGFGDDVQIKCKICEGDMDIIRYISFVDCPGHHSLTTTMLNGTCVMDAAIIVESATNEHVPAPQTSEHIKACGDIPILFGCMNKLDLVERHVAEEKIAKLKEVINVPIIPISANFGYNIDVVCEYLANMPIYKKDHDKRCRMSIVRSFDVNLQGTHISKLQGGVVGGSIIQGQLSIGDIVTIYPGVTIRGDEFSYKPIRSKVVSIHSNKTLLSSAVPGGLIAVQLSSDPSLTAHDGFVGQCLTVEDESDRVYDTVKFTYNISKKYSKGDAIVFNYNSCNITGQVAKIRPKYIIIKLENMPIYVTEETRVTFIADGCVVGTGNIIDGLVAIKI